MDKRKSKGQSIDIESTAIDKPENI